jgi:hypothetical protein
MADALLLAFPMGLLAAALADYVLKAVLYWWGGRRG